MALQGAKMSVAAEREQYERAMQKLSRLTAGAEAHTRSIADRDCFICELAMRTGIIKLPANGPLSQQNVTACVSAPLASRFVPPLCAKTSRFVCNSLQRCLRQYPGVGWMLAA